MQCSAPSLTCSVKNVLMSSDVERQVNVNASHGRWIAKAAQRQTEQLRTVKQQGVPTAQLRWLGFVPSKKGKFTPGPAEASRVTKACV